MVINLLAVTEDCRYISTQIHGTLEDVQRRVAEWYKDGDVRETDPVFCYDATTKGSKRMEYTVIEILKADFSM